MSITYCDKDDFALKRNYADFDTYHDKNPFPTEAKIEDDIQDNEDIINFELGTFQTSITDPRFTPYLKRLSVNMLLRRYGMDFAEDGDPNVRYNPHDFLFERERMKLQKIAKILAKKKVGKVVF